MESRNKKLKKEVSKGKWEWQEIKGKQVMELRKESKKKKAKKEGE